MIYPLLILFPCLGTPENAWVTRQFLPILGPREGKHHVGKHLILSPLVGTPKNAGVR